MSTEKLIDLFNSLPLEQKRVFMSAVAPVDNIAKLVQYLTEQGKEGRSYAEEHGFDDDGPDCWNHAADNPSNYIFHDVAKVGEWLCGRPKNV